MYRLTFGAGAGIVLFWSSFAFGDTVTYIISQADADQAYASDGWTANDFNGPYGILTITTPSLNSSTATITFSTVPYQNDVTSVSSLGSPYVGNNCTAANPCSYLMTDDDAVELNVNAPGATMGASGASSTATTFTYSNLTATTPKGVSEASEFAEATNSPCNGNSFSYPEDQLGCFNFSLTDNANGSAANQLATAVDSVTFTLTDATGQTWSSASDVLVGNTKFSSAAGSGNNVAAIRLYVGGTSSTCDVFGASDLCGTGYAAATTTSLTPEPKLWLPLAALLTGVVILRWRKRSRA